MQPKYLGHWVGWYFSNDIGPLNQVVHMGAYRDLADREARRGKLAADPAQPKFLEKAQPLLDGMEKKILRPAPYFTSPEIKASV